MPKVFWSNPIVAKFFLLLPILATFFILSSVTSKKLPNVYKSCAKRISLEKIKDFDTFTKIPLECGRFGQIYLFSKALKSCRKSNKSPNLVTLILSNVYLSDLLVHFLISAYHPFHLRHHNQIIFWEVETQQGNALALGKDINTFFWGGTIQASLCLFSSFRYSFNTV